MDIALDLGSEHCGFKSCHGQTFCKLEKVYYWRKEQWFPDAGYALREHLQKTTPESCDI